MYLNVLIIDDSEDDTLLLVRELNKNGYVLQFERVDSLAALEKHWNNIIGN
ncbi:MAG: hypothetical protein IPK30_11395 [Cellvibrionales bacterium]|nr:hypothetical protein [Cellvibrionales bacterium]